MSVKSNPVSKRLKTETSSEGEEESSPEEVVDGYSSSAGLSLLTSSEDGVSTLLNIFTDDILPDIFDNLKILTVNDLLSFRLVNRCWRDAATSVLLKRNLCSITLHFNEVDTDENGDAFGFVDTRPRGNLKYPPPDYEYFNYYQSRSFLSDLNELILTSPNFPVSGIRFNEMALSGFAILSEPTEVNDATRNQHHLFRFFSLHGKKIKKLWLGGDIFREALHKLLYVYLPHLNCLDLGRYSLLDEDDKDSSEFRVFLPPPATLEITEIVWGCLKNEDDNFDFEKELISVCPNLSSIKNVYASAFEVLLQIGKWDLIQDLKLEPHSTRELVSILYFLNLLINTILNSARGTVPRLKLKKLSAMFWNCGKNYNVLMKVLRIILSVCKDTLEDLEIFPAPSESLFNFFIPPLPRLQTLSLVGNCHDGQDGGSCNNTKIHFLGDVMDEAVRADKLTDDQTANILDALSLQSPQENCNIPANYFPRLRKVKILMHETKDDSQKLVRFFSVENLGPSSSVTTNPSDTLLSVTTLRWETHSKQSQYDNINMAKLFPNVAHLKIFCYHSNKLPNWVWTFSKLEKCEISGLPQNQPNTQIVDSFFTGFSQEDCAAFECDHLLTESVTMSAQVFERTRSYIGNCTNLKELKIKFFRKLNFKFASKLTALYGFQDVTPRTNIVFCFCASLISQEEIQESSKYLESVAAHVEIQKFYK